MQEGQLGLNGAIIQESLKFRIWGLEIFWFHVDYDVVLMALYGYMIEGREQHFGRNWER